LGFGPASDGAPFMIEPATTRWRQVAGIPSASVVTRTVW
jgi:hypothetical protein